MIDVLEGYSNFPRDSFDKHITTFYPLAVGLMEKDIGIDLRVALWGLFRHVGEVKFGMPEYTRPRENSVGGLSSVGATPTSPRQNFDWERGRRGSRVSRSGAP